ncbi:WAT1-related protein [Glycine soja]
MEKTCDARFSIMLNQAKPYLLTVGLQFGMAGTFIIIKATLDHGMSRFVLTVYRNAIAAIMLAPFAIIFERNVRPKMTISVFMQILALGFLELERVKLKELRSQAKVIGTLSMAVKKYPAELSLSTLICMAGALQSAVVAVIADHNPRTSAIGYRFRLTALWSSLCHNVRFLLNYVPV